jgi:tetratricopeptide (TPR) repeat protein
MRGPAVLVFGAALLAYAPSLWNGFVYDDRYVVERNPLVQDLDFPGLLTTSYWGETVDAGLYRPLTLLSFGLNRALSESAAGFHLTNVLLHGAASVLALFAASTLGLSRKGSLAAGILFALHPAQSEAVISIVGRAEILAFAFTAAAFLLFARRASPLLIGVLWLCALLSKESAAFALPLFFLHRRDTPRFLALAAALAVSLGLRVVVLGGLGVAGRAIGFLDNPLAHSSLLTRVLAAPVLLLHYARLVLWPRTLSADYSFEQIPLPSGIGDPRVLMGAALLGGLLYLATRHGKPARAACAFLVPLSGSLHLLFPLGTIFAERLLYLPILGAALGFAVLIERASPRVSTSVLIALLTICTAPVWARIPDWRDNETLFRKTVETSPFSARSHFLLGAELLERERFAEAAASFESGLAIYPVHFGARMSLGEALLAAGDASGAADAFGQALEREPGSENARRAAKDALVRSGLERARTGDFPAARTRIERALALDPRDSSVWNYLGLVSEQEGRIEEARGHYERALREDPALVEAVVNLASLSMNTGDLAAAEDLYRRAIALAPDSYEAHNGLGIVLARRGRTAEAAQAFQKAIAIDPSLATARENLLALTTR